jgi:hypothetical protein
MAAPPSATVRSTPSGIQLFDGHQTLITLSADPDISFWEKAVTPPSIDGGDKIDHTTMHNAAVKTARARSLYEVGATTSTVEWDPNVYNNIIAVVNNDNNTVTITFADGSTLAFFGYLRSFAPSELVEGSAPEATITIEATNIDTADWLTEQVPVLTSAAGT